MNKYNYVTSITIPSTIKSIGSSAFRNCGNLTSITIPDSVTSIDGYVFESCSNLTAITIPNSITSIGNSAFNGCNSLTSIAIPNSVTSIGENVFDYISSTAKFYVPNEAIKQLLLGKGYPKAGTDQKVINVLQANITNVTDIADNGDGRDLQVEFNKSVDESLVSSYRIMAVKTDKVAAFNLAKANSVAAGNYTTVDKTGENITQTLAVEAKDTDGDPIANGQAYKIFVLIMELWQQVGHR